MTTDTQHQADGYVERDPGDLTIDEMYGRTPQRGFFAAVRSLRDAKKCDACDKTMFVLNTGRRGFKPETVTLATHCSCVGGPAHHLLSGAGSGAEV